MRLFQFLHGTNPVRVALFLAEKGIEMPRVILDGEHGEHKTPAFLAINPAGKAPVLQLDDGSFLPESAAIVEYLDELNPDPPLIGTSPQQRAKVRALERMANDLIVQSALWLMHFHRRFSARVNQEPLVATALKPPMDESLRVLEMHLGGNEFLAGNRPTIADCTLFALLYTCRVRLGEPLGASQPGLDAWYKRFESRPSVIAQPQAAQPFTEYLHQRAAESGPGSGIDRPAGLL